MSDPYIGEIQIFGFNFNPRGWAFCNGAVLPISQNTALFALLGTTHGGNGQSTFQLPNLAARAACHFGQGPGLGSRAMGETFGASTATLSILEIPPHSHGVNAFTQPDPAKRTSAPVDGGGLSYLTGSATAKSFVGTAPNTQFSAGMIAATQGGQPHENRQPYLGVNFCIALQGIFPSFP